MKKTYLTKLIAIFFACVAVICAFAVTAFANVEPEAVEIFSKNVYYGDTLKLMFAIKVPDGATATVTAKDSKGNSISIVPYNAYSGSNVTTVKGTEVQVFISELGVAEQNIDEIVTVTATANGTSDTQTYSVLEYLYERLLVSSNVTELQREVYLSLLDYANKADMLLNGASSKDCISNYRYVKAVNCNISGMTAGVFYCDTKINFTSEIVADKGYEVVYKIRSLDSGISDTLTEVEIANAGYTVTGHVSVEAVLIEHQCSFEDWVITKDPTCTEEGEQEAVCRCGEKQTQSIEKNNHLYDEDGVCTVCGSADIDEGLVFTLSGDEYSVTDYTGSAAKVIIPAIYQGKPVTSIGYPAFSDCTTITSVKIPDSIVSIEDGAFKNCTALTQIVIPDSVKTIGLGAFRYCNSLEIMTIPFVGSSEDATGYASRFPYIFGASSSQYISSYVPASLKTVVITGGDHIADNAFGHCQSIESISIPDSVKTIGDYAFGGCSSIKSIFVPNSVTNIREHAFRDCTALETITIPFVGASADATGYEAHFGYIFGYVQSPATGTASYHYYDGEYNYVYYIPESLKNVNISEGATRIGDHAFQFCDQSLAVTVPDSITSIGYRAFYYCKNLAKMEFGEDSKLNSIGAGAFWKCTALTAITIPNGVTRIEESTFYECVSLTELKISDFVTYIGKSAFYGCVALEEIVLPASLTEIGDSAFENCTNISNEVVLGNKCKTIGTRAFKNCTLIESITIPESVTYIGASSVNGCKKIIWAYTGTTKWQVKIPSIYGQCPVEGGSGKTLTNLTAPVQIYTDPSLVYYAENILRKTVTVNSGVDYNVAGDQYLITLCFGDYSLTMIYN